MQPAFRISYRIFVLPLMQPHSYGMSNSAYAVPELPVPPPLLYHILYRIFVLLLIQLHISHRSARSLPEYVLLHMPERPVLHMPGRPILHTPELPVLHIPERPVLHMPGWPVLHTPELPVLHMPGRPAVLQIDFHRMYRTVHLLSLIHI